MAKGVHVTYEVKTKRSRCRGYSRHWFVCHECGGWQDTCNRIGCGAPNPNAGKPRFQGGGWWAACECGKHG